MSAKAGKEYYREWKRRQAPRNQAHWLEGRKLREAFEAVKLRTQSEAAQVLGMSQSRFQQMEREIWWKIAVRMKDPGFMPAKYKCSQL
jgi:hypothetical protein